MPTPGDIAPLEVGSVAPQMQISDAPLDSLIQRVRTAQPALAASLRMTDQAREQILNHHEDDAIQTLTGAMSIDGGDPYAYFYLGRAYLEKKKYDQAVTFLSRAENRLGDNPQWLGETLAFEGLANEQAGQTPQAIACYQKALVAVPGDLMARVGLTRLGGSDQLESNRSRLQALPKRRPEKLRHSQLPTLLLTPARWHRRPRPNLHHRQMSMLILGIETSAMMPPPRCSRPSAPASESPLQRGRQPGRHPSALRRHRSRTRLAQSRGHDAADHRSARWPRPVARFATSTVSP